MPKSRGRATRLKASRTFRQRIATGQDNLRRLRELDTYPDAGRVNAYQCTNCKGYTVTVHRDQGATPMFLVCQASDTCRGKAVSTFYSATELLPTLEWYRPGRNQRLSHGEREHVEAGGLLLRPVEADLIHLVHHRRATTRAAEHAWRQPA